MDIERQRLNTKIDRLVQRMAMLENAVEEKNIVKANFSSTNTQTKMR